MAARRVGPVRARAQIVAKAQGPTVRSRSHTPAAEFGSACAVRGKRELKQNLPASKAGTGKVLGTPCSEECASKCESNENMPAAKAGTGR